MTSTWATPTSSTNSATTPRSTASRSCAPSVNTSEAVFSARDGKIFYAIGAIKGVGQAVAEHIVEARGDTPFRDLADFATRVDPRIINKRTLETLVNAGAFD